MINNKKALIPQGIRAFLSFIIGNTGVLVLVVEAFVIYQFKIIL